MVFTTSYHRISRVGIDLRVNIFKEPELFSSLFYLWNIRFILRLVLRKLTKLWPEADRALCFLIHIKWGNNILSLEIYSSLQPIWKVCWLQDNRHQENVICSLTYVDSAHQWQTGKNYYDWLRPRCFSHHTIDILGPDNSLSWKHYPVRWRSRISGSLDVSSIPPSCDKQKYLCTLSYVPLRVKRPPHWELLSVWESTSMSAIIYYLSYHQIFLLRIHLWSCKFYFKMGVLL